MVEGSEVRRNVVMLGFLHLDLLRWQWFITKRLSLVLKPLRACLDYVLDQIGLGVIVSGLLLVLLTH